MSRKSVQKELLSMNDKNKGQQNMKSQPKQILNISKIQQPQQIKKQIIQQQVYNPEKNKKQYYNFFKNIIKDPQNYIPQLPSDKEFKNHKIKYLKGNIFQQKLQSYDQTYITVKNTQIQGAIVIYTVIIGMFQLQITLLNINKKADIQQNNIGSGTFGSVRIESQNKRMFAVKRQMFQDKYFFKMANKHQINQAIKQLAIYKICSLLKIGPAAETDIGFDLICYSDCIEFQIQYCMKIEYGSGYEKIIYVDLRIFETQIKICLLTLHFYGIIHKDIKPANILFSVKYNKYVLTDFGISHPVGEKIGYRSETRYQGTPSFMLKQMRQIKERKTGQVHLYGNDVWSLQLTLIKRQTKNQNIEKGMKKFNQKIIQQYNTKYEYEYLKLKYYCFKPDINMKEVQNYWRYMDRNRMEELLSIIDKSIEFDKIKSVYNYLSKLEQFEKWNLESLKIQSQSIKNIKIAPNIKMNTQLHLKNTLRVYGYSRQVKDMIIKLKLQQKYEEILKNIDKIIDENIEVNYRDSLFGNHRNYIKKIKNELDVCQSTKDYKGIFHKYIIILKYGNKQEIIQTIQKLKILNYERKKEEKVEEMIRVNKIEKNKEKIKQFIQLMENKNEEMDKIITERRLQDDVSEIYNYIGNYEKALQYYTKSVNMTILFYGQQHPSVADTYNNIANLYNSMGKYEHALQYLNKSVNMSILFHGQQHPIVADTYNNIANLYQKMGKYEKSLQYYTKSVKMEISFHGQQHPSVAVTYNNIGLIYRDIGKYDKALQYLFKSVDMKISFHGQQHPSIAMTYKNIGLIYSNKGKQKKALQYYTKSVNMIILFYGQQHPFVADIYNNIANVYNSMGKYEHALQYLNKSVKMQISFNGQQHPSVAITYKNIGRICKDTGKYDKALQYYTKSVNMQILLYGQQHPNVADSNNNIAVVYQKMGKYEKALQYYTKSVNMQIIFHGQQHPSIADTYNNIASVYKYMGKYEKALQLYTKSVNMKIYFHGQQHPYVAVIYLNIGGIYKDIGKYNKALQYYTKSVNMTMLFHGQQHPNVAATYNNIAGVYHQMEKYEKALQYYNKSVKMQISFHGQQRPFIAGTYNNISMIYFKISQLNVSLKYCNKSIRIQSNLSLMQYPQTADCYHQLSTIFHKKEKDIKSLHYEYSALDTFLKTCHFDNHKSPYYLSKLADIYYQMNRFIQSYFFYRLSCQISVKYFPIHDRNLRKAKYMMNEMQWSMPSLIHNYITNIQFINEISNKYSQIPNYKLMKLLSGKKWQLRFEQQNRSRRDRFQYLKCVIQIYLCYKYLGYMKQMKKAGAQIKEELFRLEQSQQKQMFQEFRQEISGE